MSVRAERPTSVPARPEPNRYRSDIQGLRAIASLLVASFHIWFGTVSGGVDLFFVLGGFLLATTLVGELERRGSIRAWQYVKRTATRLFPMAGLVLIVVSAVLLMTESPLSFQRNVTDIFAAATYWENWRLAGDATDYISAGHDKSAVQHFWAMSVQGQATLLLLAFVLILGAIAKLAKWRVRRVATAGLALLTAASLIYALNGVASDPVPTYYSTWARLWEFGIGAVAALVMTRIHLPKTVRALLGSLGLALVLTAGLLPSEWPYPGLIALYPVGGALLVLISGASGELSGGNRLLTWRPLVWLGGFSYGLYLSSWPILKLFVELFPERSEPVSFLDGLLLLAVSIAVAWAMSRFLAFLGRVRNPVAQVDSTAPRWKRNPRLLTSVSVPLIAIVAFVGVQLAPGLRQEAIADLGPGQTVTSEQQLSLAITEALLEPTALNGEAVSGWDALGPEWSVNGCLTVTDDNRANCRYAPEDADQDSGEELWIVGDSQAVSWAPGVRAAVGDETTVQLLGKSMCPFTQGAALDRSGDMKDECAAHNNWVMELAAADRPDTVIISYGGWWVGEQFGDLAWNKGTTLGEGSVELVRELTEMGIDVIWLDAVTPANSLDACLAASTRQQAEESCTSAFGPEFVERRDHQAEQMAAGGAAVVRTSDWFCDVELGLCPLVVAGISVHSDPTHVGREYSVFLADVIAQGLADARTE
ncbi:acyltransferase family protein [Pseudoclavibacter sp. AY1H1]|uniref:acyltransferase family protein n=1 Tax=Pseudoclavibacter sp. AY1H1 TaxID=2080584 RepID=UPI000CE923B7|nr:acyltransferase family protein [Pseudoclavibacter sp. AY1H1]PPF38640.1 hypothetical protein C5E05_06505 [Pseudoclavibacter sp. AY1H1]